MLNVLLQRWFYTEDFLLSVSTLWENAMDDRDVEITRLRKKMAHTQCYLPVSNIVLQWEVIFSIDVWQVKCETWQAKNFNLQKHRLIQLLSVTYIGSCVEKLIRRLSCQLKMNISPPTITCIFSHFESAISKKRYLETDSRFSCIPVTSLREPASLGL